MQELDDCIRRVVPPRFIDDFKQELFVRLINYPDGVIAAYNDGRHKFYIVRVIISLAQRERDIFHRKYLSKETCELPDYGEEHNYCEPSDFEIRRIKESEEERLLRNIETIEEKTGTCYYRLMISALKIHGSYRAVSRATGIPVKSVSNAMKKIREIIKQ